MKNKYYMGLGVVLLLLFSISVAYAAYNFTQNLNITTVNVSQSGIKWNVHFVAGTVNASEASTNGTGYSCGAATVTTSSVTVADTELSINGKTCTYPIQIKNEGDVAAKLGAITLTATPTATVSPSGTVTCTASNGNAKITCGSSASDPAYITYTLATNSAGSTPISTSNVSVAIGGTTTIYLVVKNNKTALATSTVSLSAATFSLRFDQN